MKFRVTIRGLIALVLFIGFALAALRGATLGWAAASIVLALLVLCTAAVGSLMCRGPGRAFWVGFAVFGWVYFLLHLGPTAQWKTGYGPARFTTWAIDGILLPLIYPELEGGAAFAGIEEFVILRSGRSGSFLCAAGHALMSILFGVLGSVVGPIVAGGSVEGRRSESAGSATPRL